MQLELRLELLSDATFGRGDGVAGLVDVEVEHDAATGLPFLRGRTLRGLLVEACADILYALELQRSAKLEEFKTAARYLFGQPGSTLQDDGMLHIGTAQLPEQLREAVKDGIKRGTLTAPQILSSLTAIRRQTAVDTETGAPRHGSLRSMRVILRETSFFATFTLDREPDEKEIKKEIVLGLLAACVASLHRVGLGRNRGRGQVRTCLVDQGQDVTQMYLSSFRAAITGAKP